MKKDIICKSCKNPGHNNGRGLCSSCYKKEWRKLNPDKAKQHNKTWREKTLNRARIYYKENRETLLKNSKKWREANKHKIKNKYLKYQYGITTEQYDQILDDQNCCCKLCGSSPIKYPVVEHCHKTGRIRGIVCQKCNMAIAAVENNQHLLNKILEYIETDETTKNSSV